MYPTGARLGSPHEAGGNNRFPHAPACGEYTLVGANGGSPAVHPTPCRGERRFARRPPNLNKHPPLGVNATHDCTTTVTVRIPKRFNGHPPLGVNATSV